MATHPVPRQGRGSREKRTAVRACALLLAVAATLTAGCGLKPGVERVCRPNDSRVESGVHLVAAPGDGPPAAHMRLSSTSSTCKTQGR